MSSEMESVRRCYGVPAMSMPDPLREALEALERYLHGEAGLPFTDPYPCAREAAEHIRAALAARQQVAEPCPRCQGRGTYYAELPNSGDTAGTYVKCGCQEEDAHDPLREALIDIAAGKTTIGQAVQVARAALAAHQQEPENCAVRGDLHGTPVEWPERQPMDPAGSGTPQAQPGRVRQQERAAPRA